MGFATAQDSVDYSIDIENFRPSSDPFGYTVTDSATTLQHLNMGVGVWWNRSDDPLVLLHNGGRVLSPVDGLDGVVSQRNTLDLQVGIGITKYFSLSVDLPVVLWQEGFKPEVVPLDDVDIDSSGLSDLRIAPKVVFLRTGVDGPVGLALVTRLMVPTGVGSHFTGEESIALGLSDGLGSVSSVAEEVFGQPFLIDYHGEENLLDKLTENFIIRLLRGSGLKGLVSFNQFKTSHDNNLKIVRPLISFMKNDLNFISTKVFKFKFEDPSNKNTDFKRIRIRNLINNLKSEGMNLEKLRLTINNLTDSSFTINFYVEENIKSNSKYFSKKQYYILSNSFFNKPNEIVFRSLINLIKKIGNKYYPPRGKSISQLLSRFKSGEIKKINISGCILEKISNSFIIYKEK